MSLNFSIISRGTLLVTYKGKSMKISGELTFEPPVFYADINSMNKWEEPNDSIPVLEDEKREIIQLALENKGETKIVFD